MSFVNNVVPVIRSIIRRHSNDDRSERIQILHSNQTLSASDNVKNDEEVSQRSSFSKTAASLAEDLKKSAPQNEPFREHGAFLNEGFSPPSDLDLQRSWKLEKRSTDMNGSVAQNGLRRTKSECQISLNNQVFDNSFRIKKYGTLHSKKAPAHTKAKNYFKSKCVCNFACIASFITSIFPIISWLPKYQFSYLLPDIISGFTIAILHIPQGMAYGILASVNAENGLYVSFFPVLIYFLLGTSKHISIGTFAVMSLMVSSAVYSMDDIFENGFNLTNQNSSNSSLDGDSIANAQLPPTHLEIVTSLALAVGFWQIFMGIFHLGSLTVVLSDLLVSGFTTGAACHVATSQLKDLFGIYIGRYSGPLKVVYMLRDAFHNLIHTNIATLIISAVAIFTLAIFKEQIQKRVKEKLKIPIPIDLIVVVLATTISYLANFNKNYDVDIMANIPTGLPEPTPPKLEIIRLMIGDSFAIAVVAFAVSLSMAKLLSKKHKYIIRPNQELLALGSANIFASFFACYPCSASLSRSLVQERTGGKTQVAGLVSCGIILLVLLALAPLFYSLPKCILSCIILVALKGMFMQVTDLYKMWSISKLDSLIWLVTFLSTVFLDVTYGLLVGIIFSILTVVIRTVIPSKTFLGRIPNTDIYLDINRYETAEEIEGIKIFRFESALYFINRELFKSYLIKHVSLNNFSEEGSESKIYVKKVRRIIIDCSTFSFVDVSGLDTILEIMKEYQEVGIIVVLAECSIAMQSLMEKSKFFDKVLYHPSIFTTIQNAVDHEYYPQTTFTNS